MLSAASRRFALRGAPEAPEERERQRQGERERGQPERYRRTERERQKGSDTPGRERAQVKEALGEGWRARITV